MTNVSDSCMDENALCDRATKHCICGQDFYDDDGDSANVGGVCIPSKYIFMPMMSCDMFLSTFYDTHSLF